MSRTAVAQLSSGAEFGASLERPTRARANAIDHLLAELSGAPLMHVLQLTGPLRLAYGQRVVTAAERLAGLDDAAFDRLIPSVLQSLRAQGPVAGSLDESLALVCEAARRCLGKQPYPVQVLAARELVRGRIIEMATGEGKSLTAALAAAVMANCGVPVDIFTVNVYLARRDADAMRPLFDRLGLSVAAVDGPAQSPERRAAYAADVVYVVNKDYVFDYLRHRQAANRDPFAGRGLFFAIVDEADSILIDEARTPLILARERGAESTDDLIALLGLARSLALDTDYSISTRLRKVELLAAGRERLKHWIGEQSDSPTHPYQVQQERLEQALCALQLYQRDRDYVLRDDKVQIVDESTGRILADRTWQRGLHQFIELKEGLTPTLARETIASLTYPQFFRKYLRLAGMSGTVAENAGELRRNYGTQVLCVPTHRPVARDCRGPFIHADSTQRWAAVVEAAVDGVAQGRAVLIGTRSVQASEVVASRLAAMGVDHVVLNARNDEAEAAIVAQAGRTCRVTVATNMAGRGTDILIDETVLAAGGLLVILTEFHESTRVDRQLFGRCARQGDPGLALAHASLEDELFVKFLPPLALSAARHLAGRQPLGQALPTWFARGLLAIAQRGASAGQRVDRDANLASDDTLRDQLGFAGDAA
jgi:preprotein translocase subunit SecA